MSDSNIHDSGFAGSPIVSYGQASTGNRTLKLLALIAGSFAVVFALFFFCFWFFASLPIPKNVVVLAVVPASVTLPASVPEAWSSAQKNNSPLPTVLGYVQLDDNASQEIKNPTPFAIRVFSIVDLFRSGKTSIWSLAIKNVDTSLVDIDYQTPWHLVGSPIKGRRIWLKIWPKRLLTTISDPLDVPNVLEGYYQNGFWRINSTEYGIRGTWQESNFTQVTNPGSDYLAKFAAINGLQIRMPSSSVVSWNTDRGLLDISIRPSSSNLVQAALGLTQDVNLMNKTRESLGDQTIYDEYFRLDDTNLNVSTTLDVFNYTLNSGFVVNSLPNSMDESKNLCPGDVLASFDRTSIRNLCSWVGICFDYPQNLIVSQQENVWNFCVQW